MREVIAMSAVHALRPYQSNIFYAVMDSIYEQKGLTFTVEIAAPGWQERTLRSTGIFPAF